MNANSSIRFVTGACRARTAIRSVDVGRRSLRCRVPSGSARTVRTLALGLFVAGFLALAVSVGTGAGGGAGPGAGSEIGFGGLDADRNANFDSNHDPAIGAASHAVTSTDASHASSHSSSESRVTDSSLESVPFQRSLTRADDVPIGDDEPDPDDVVVRLEDDNVVTAAVADRMPSEPFVTAGDERLVVAEHDEYDMRIVQNADGEVATAGGRAVRRISNETDLVVLDDRGSIRNTIVVNRETGVVETDDGEHNVKVDGAPVVYEESEETDVVPVIQNVTDVSEGDTLEVETQFRNPEWGDATDLPVHLRLLSGNDVHENVTETISVDGGERTNATLSYETTHGDHDVSELEVETDGNIDRTSHSIGTAGAAVTITDTNEPVEGDNLSVTAEIERYGQIPAGEQDYPVNFFVNGTEVDTEVVSLEPGETTTETFTYETDRDDVPHVETKVASPSASDSTDVDVLLRMAHEQNVRSEIMNVSAGNQSEELVVNTSFWYDGSIPGNETEVPVEFTVDGAVEERRNVTLDGTATQTTFRHAFADDAPPIRNATIETPGQTNSLDLEHDVPVTFDDVTDPAARNETLSATVTAENRGDTPGRVPLTVAAENPYAVESNGTARTAASLEPGESMTETVNFNLTDDAPTELELRANTTTGVATESVEIRDNVARFEIENTTVRETPGSTNVTVLSTIRNAGGVTGTQDVQLAFDGTTLRTDSVTLEPDETTTISADVAAEDGTYSYGAATDDDAVSATTDVDHSSSGPLSGVLNAVSLDGFVMPLVALSVLGLVLGGAIVIKQRADPDDIPVEIPDEIHDRVAALQPAARRLQSAARNLVSNDGTGTVVVQNNLPRKALVRIRIRSADEILFLEDFELAADERRTLECLPSVDQFDVGSGVDDIAAHEETFDRDTREVGVVLQPDGITIAEL